MDATAILNASGNLGWIVCMHQIKGCLERSFLAMGSIVQLPRKLACPLTPTVPVCAIRRYDAIVARQYTYVHETFKAGG